MRWVNGAFDPHDISADLASKLTCWINSMSSVERIRAIKVVNPPEWLICAKDKEKILYYLVDEDFINERFAITWLVDMIIRQVERADAYAD